MDYPPKVVGQTCDQCHKAKYVLNPKTGKIFCEDKCWLKGQEPIPAQPEIPKRDFAKENFGKCKYGFLLEMYKKGLELEMAEPKAEEWADASLRKMHEEPKTDDSVPF